MENHRCAADGASARLTPLAWLRFFSDVHLDLLCAIFHVPALVAPYMDLNDLHDLIFFAHLVIMRETRPSG